MLQVLDLVKTYHTKDNQTVHAVSGINFSLEAGSILAFLGPNGAGKTTSIKMIGGLVRPNSGDVRIGGYSVTKHSGKALRQVGAVLEGSRNLYWRLTPLENFEYWGGIRGVSRRESRQRGRALMTEFGLEHKLKSTVQQLSRGMQQQVSICAALIHEPSLLLLDEPTLGLDLDASDRIQSYVLRLAHELGVAILLTTHQMEVAQTLADDVAIIQNGNIGLRGSKADVLGQHSGNWYTIELGEPANDEVKKRLTSYEAEWTMDTICRVQLSDGHEIHAIMHQLEPLPVVRFGRDTPNLATVFRRHTRQSAANEEVTVECGMS